MHTLIDRPLLAQSVTSIGLARDQADLSMAATWKLR
jgi:hypothetical protein